MPSVGAVRSAAPKLLAAVASQEGPRALEALDEMGVLGLCPPPDQQFRRLEFGVGTVIGRARLLPLVELAVFAAEGGDLARASAYLTEAHTLSPRSSDLHILHTVAGIISLGAGKLAEACGYLAESVRVCQRDGVACLRCRSRAPNLMLAERLLEHGEKAAVVEYLIQCQDVWRHFEGPIAAWVGAIQNDQETHLGLGTFADDPAIKIRVLLETNFLGQVPEATTKEIGRGPGPSLEDLRAKLDRENAEAVKGKLQTGRN